MLDLGNYALTDGNWLRIAVVDDLRVTNVWREYQAARPFDIMCLTRPPEYTPAEADPIFDALAERFIDASTW